ITLEKYIPEFVSSGLRLITGILDGIADNIGAVITAGADVIIAFLEGIGREVPRVVDAGQQMIIDVINGIAESIRANQGTLDAAVANLADAMISSFVSSVSNVGEIGADIVRGIAGGI